jgi:hypothetical protein
MGRPGTVKKGEIRNPKGRGADTKNKISIERERIAFKGMFSAANRKAMGQKLAREVMAEIMHRWWTIADKAYAKGDEDEAKAFSILALDAAAKLAPYESPRLQSITIHKPDPFAAMGEHQLWAELRQRAADIGLTLPAEPVLIEGVANKQG